MGPWSANRAALNMLHLLEKQKVKTPYERHYLLLCLVTAAFLQIHSLCEQMFQSIENEKERIYKFSSPKVLRLLETLRLFKPEENANENEELGKITKDIDKLDFNNLRKNLENTYYAVDNINKKESKEIIQSLDPIIQPTITNYKSPIFTKTHASHSNVISSQLTNNLKSRRHHNGGQKKRTYVRRYNRDNTNDSDLLCGIVFCNTKYKARVLFELLAEMSRNDLSLKFLKCQYTTDRVADPITEPKEAELEHRRQEEVLKRFRIHDCNLLIGTSVLEEGMDLPKCNLVVRWDPPLSYRSYVQCKGRARASQAYHIILVAARLNQKQFLCNSETLNDQSHNFICGIKQEASESDSDSNEEEILDIDVVSEDLKNCSVNSSSIGIGTVKILNPEVITTKPPFAMPPISKIDISIEEIESLTMLENANEKINEPNEFEMNAYHTCFEVISMDDAIARQESELELICNDLSLIPSTQDLPMTVNKLSPKYNHSPACKRKKKIKGCSVPNTTSVNYTLTNKADKLNEMEISTEEIVNRLAEYQEIEKVKI